jgi:transcriptional regulator with XRE-family HTH domain
MGFKENIKNRRLELHMTLDEVSNKLGISKPTLQRYESGVIENIPFDKVERLAEILNTTPSWLVGWSSDSLSIKEKEILSKYNKLDDISKNIIEVVLEMELKRK